MKNFGALIMGFIYIITGLLHFYRPKVYVRIMPTWVPAHLTLVYFSGVCEILLGVLLFPIVTRKFAAWGIIALLICIFPANIQMMQNYRVRMNPYLWITIARLPLQLVLIWWAWQYTK